MPQPYACCLRRAAPTSASCAQQSRRVPLGPSSSGQPAVRCQPTPLGHECCGSVGKLANALEQCVTPVWIVPLSNYERTHPSACLALCPCGCAALWPVQRKVNPQWPVLTSMQACCGRAGDIKARLALATAWYTRLCRPSLCRPSCQSVAPQPNRISTIWLLRRRLAFLLYRVCSIIKHACHVSATAAQPSFQRLYAAL